MLLQKIIISNEKIINYYLIFLIIFYPIIFIWQCGDLTDTGFVAYIFENYFDNIKANQIFSPTFLTDLIGAIWFKLFPNLGILGLKILYLLFFYPLIYFIYLILKSFSNNKTLLYFSILCGIIFSERCFNFVYGKDISCWFFLVISGYLFIQGIDFNRKKLIFLSGVFLMLASISRLTSVSGIVIFPIIILYKYFYKENKYIYNQFKSFFKTYFLFLSGFVLSLLLFLLILKMSNLLDVFLNNFDSIGKMSSKSYDPFTMIIKISKEFLIFIPCTFLVILFFTIGSFVYKYSIKESKLIYFVVFVILILYIIVYFDHSFYHGHSIKYLAPAFCFWPLLYSLIKKDKFSTTVFVCIVIAVAQVLGTNTGFFLKLLYGLAIIFPLTILILDHYKTMPFQRINISTISYSISGVFIILIISLLTRIFFIYNVIYGTTVRFDSAIYLINNPKMKGILTTKENSKHIEDLCNAIKNSISNNKTLFIYGHQPMFYYLTNKKSIVENLWLNDGQRQPKELFLEITEIINKTKKWPLIVDTKQKILNEEGELELKKFLKTNKYICKINQKDFAVWVKN